MKILVLFFSVIMYIVSFSEELNIKDVLSCNDDRIRNIISHSLHEPNPKKTKLGADLYYQVKQQEENISSSLNNIVIPEILKEHFKFSVRLRSDPQLKLTYKYEFERFPEVNLHILANSFENSFKKITTTLK